MKYLMGILMTIATFTHLVAQEKEEVIKKAVSFENTSNPTLWIDNISGGVEVAAYNGTNVILEITKHIKADTDEELAAAWKKLNPAIITGSDTVEVYVEGVCDCDSRKGHYWRECDNDYNFNFDFKVRIPTHTNLWISTINNGDITVTGVNGKLKINNINGGIKLEKVSGPTDVHTINGDVYVSYTQNPDGKSSYYTLNGKLTVYFLPDLSSDVNLKSFNGKFYTDFAIADVLPSQLVTTTEGERGMKYKLDEKTAVRIGKGGVLLDFETFNGDIYIRKL